MKQRLYGKRINEKAGSVLAGVLLLVVLLITAAQSVCYWIPGWWRQEYSKYNTPQYVTGEMSLDDAVYVTEQMLEYCIGRLDTLDNTEASIDGVTAPFFTEREKSHLSDCRNIFLAAVRFRVISVLVILGLLVGIWFAVAGRLEREGVRREFARVLAGGYLAALAIVLVLALIITVIGMHDFTYLFTKFHELFFDNDLWILDPREDNLVNIMQEAVFSDAAVTIASIWAVASAALAGLSAAVLRNTR